MFIVVRTVSDQAGLAQTVTRQIHAADPGVPVFQIQTMQQRLYDSLARQRFAAIMLGAFAAFGLILAAVGVYGVISFLVTQSTHDIGLHVALGAQRGNVIRMVLGQEATLTAAGIMVGLLGALTLTCLMSALLFGVSATDAATFSSVALTLAIVALTATLIPALRATRIDPIVALREE